MTQLVSTVAERLDRAVQKVTPLAYRVRRQGRRLMRRALRKPRSVSEGPNLLRLLIQVLASFSKADGVCSKKKLTQVSVFCVTIIPRRFTPSCVNFSARRYTSSRT